jgi:hypothetical protein
MTISGITTQKFVIIINKKLDVGVALNAGAHISLGLVSRVTTEVVKEMMFLDFIDKDGGIHPNISALSLIVLRGTSGEIRKARNEAIARNVLFTDFTNTMTGDTYIEQLERTKTTHEAELEYYGLGLFGEKTVLEEFTRKLSLWK